MPVDSKHVESARVFARLLASNGIGIVYGGSESGIMKILADTALESGGEVTGVFTKSLEDEQIHPGLTESVFVENLAERKTALIEMADAVVALPGGFGTLDELFDAIARRRMYRGGHTKPLGLLNVNGYYDALFEFLIQVQLNGYSSAEDTALLISSSNPVNLLERLNDAVGPPGISRGDALRVRR
jgi:uncharacterized protein (TIGR00730 family)